LVDVVPPPRPDSLPGAHHLARWWYGEHLIRRRACPAGKLAGLCFPVAVIQRSTHARKGGRLFGGDLAADGSSTHARKGGREPTKKAQPVKLPLLRFFVPLGPVLFF
jgi:hypothetical protein